MIPPTSIPISPARWLEIAKTQPPENPVSKWVYLLDDQGGLPTTWSDKLYSRDLNVQGVPKVFRATISVPGHLVVEADWSACHARIWASKSGDEQLVEDIASGDLYARVADAVGLQADRTAVKNAYNAWMYGAGPDAVGDYVDEPDAFVARLARRYPTLMAYREHVVREVVDNDHEVSVVLPAGRTTVQLDDDADPPQILAEYAQGHARLALMHAWAAIEQKVGDRVQLIMPLHDALILAVDPGQGPKKTAGAIRSIEAAMIRYLLGKDSPVGEGAVSIECGPTWGQLSEARDYEPAPDEERRSRQEWVERGLAQLDAVLDDPKGRALAIQRAPYAVEMAMIDQPTQASEKVVALKLVSGGREAHSMLRSIEKRVTKQIRPWVERARNRAKVRELEDQGHKVRRALTLGSHVEVATMLLAELGGLDDDGKPTGTMVDALGTTWKLNSISGVWEEMPDYDLETAIQEYDGRLIIQDESARPLRLKHSDIRGIAKVAAARIRKPSHFDHMGEDGIPTLSGMIATDGQLRPFTPTDGVRSSDLTPMEYDPAATARRWLQFLDEVFEGTDDKEDRIKLLQEFVGGALAGVSTRYQQMLVMLGEGRNGKSTLMETIQGLFHPHAVSSMAPQALSGQQGEYHAARLSSSRINVCAEMPEREISQSETFKAVITGERTTARHPSGRPFEFCSRAGWVVSANRLPMVRDTTSGYWRRMLVLAFDNKFEGDKADRGLKTKLMEELPGILTWAVEGLRRLTEQKGYTIPQSCRIAVSEWKHNANSVAAWAVETIEPDENNRLPAGPLYREYAVWARDNGHKPVSARRFGQDLPDLGYRKIKSGSMFYMARYKPTELRPESPDLDDLFDDPKVH